MTERDLSPAGERALRALAKGGGSAPASSFNGHSVRSLVRLGYAEVDDETLRITGAGEERAGVKTAPVLARPTKSRAVEAPATLPGWLDEAAYRRLREEIEARYARDLEALDRVWEICRAVAVEPAAIPAA